MTTSAVYAGSFDPPTLGHEWMIRQGAAMFPRLIVAIGQNPSKRSSYSVDQRLKWLREICEPLKNVEVDAFGNLLLVNYCHQRGATHLLRGVRSAEDFGYEQTMRHINADLDPKVTTVFLMPPREIAEVSSSLVRGMLVPEGGREVVRRYLPACVYRDLAGGNA